jgi:hypothetical protein
MDNTKTTYRYTFQSGADHKTEGVNETHENETLTIEKGDGTKVPFHPVKTFEKKLIFKL